MRIVKNTEEQFILEERPVFWALIKIFFLMSTCARALNAVKDRDYAMAGFAVLATIGLGYIAFLIVERVWLVLDRQTGTVELRRRSLRRFCSDVFPLSELDRDGILIQADEGTLRIALRLASRPAPLPMTRYHQTGGNVRPCAEAARKWLAAALVRA